MRLLAVALIALLGVTPVFALDLAVSKHYDPGHIGHKHQCKGCGAMYNQPGDNGPGSSGTYVCRACGYNNSPAMPQPPVNPPYHPPQPPYNPGNPGQPTQPTDPNQSPDYQAGYTAGHSAGFREGYSQGFQEGRQAGEREGRADGERDGYNKFIARYTSYVYTSEKLKDLINSLQLPPRQRFAPIVEAPAPELPGIARYGGPNYSRGYNDGLYAGRNEGRNKGHWDGRSETYDKVYREAFRVGHDRADREMHTWNGRVLTMDDQFRAGLDHHARGEWAKARLRFNLILMEAPANQQVREAALWYAGDTLLREGDNDGALAVFLVHHRAAPRAMLEATSLRIAKLLLDVKTGGFIGIGATKYVDRAKAILDWWIASFPRHDDAPEAWYTLGQTHEKLKNKEEAKRVYLKVIEMYPQTRFAEEAKKRLKKMDAWYNNL